MVSIGHMTIHTIPINTDRFLHIPSFSEYTALQGNYIKMASKQLEVQTPKGASGITVRLSENTRVVAHAAQQSKAGYITISRVRKDTQRWRNVHISKRSFEKLRTNAAYLLEGAEKKEYRQVCLTKKQFLTVTRFEREGMATLFFISIMHPTTECENLGEDTEYHHNKTINMSTAEFEKFILHMDSLKNAMETVDETSKQSEVDESETICVYRFKRNSKLYPSTSLSAYPTKEECAAALSQFTEAHDFMTEEDYTIFSEDIFRLSKVRVLEYVYFRLVLQKTGVPIEDLWLRTATSEEVDQAMKEVTKLEVVTIATVLGCKLNYKRLYMLNELFDIMVYGVGLDRLRNLCLSKDLSPTSNSFQNLLEYLIYKHAPKVIDPKNSVVTYTSNDPRNDTVVSAETPMDV